MGQRSNAADAARINNPKGRLVAGATNETY